MFTQSKRGWKMEDGGWRGGCHHAFSILHAPSSILAALIVTCFCAPLALADFQLHDSVGTPAASQPSKLKDIGIDQHLGAQIPTDLRFTDETGHEVRLGDYFNKSNRPIILTLVYYQCPMLCTMELNELVRTMNGMSSLVCGKDYDVLTVSFNPNETPDLAAKKRYAYLYEYAHKKEAANAWHFLVGDQPAIRALTSTVGFRYKWDPKYKQYLHVTGIMVLTPEGKISKYFYGVDYNVRDLRLALLDASHQKVGSLADQILLFCCSYDPTTGKYTLAVLNLLKVGGALTVLLLGGYVFKSFRRNLRDDRRILAQQAHGKAG
jgi:protein SCO1/2